MVLLLSTYRCLSGSLFSVLLSVSPGRGELRGPVATMRGFRGAPKRLPTTGTPFRVRCLCLLPTPTHLFLSFAVGPVEWPWETTLVSDLRSGSARGGTSEKRRGPESGCMPPPSPHHEAVSGCSSEGGVSTWDPGALPPLLPCGQG